jgi:geranylgeranyl diphosphate synthase type II
MDDDELRRGKPTNHKVYGDGMAILAGDALLNTAYEVMYKDLIYYFDTPECLSCKVNAGLAIAKGSGIRGMIAGQAADIENENKACSNEMLDYVHVNKTGALITAAIRAGLYLGGAKDAEFERLTTFAENYGLAYQISDDILDVIGNAEEMGKMPNVDQERGKNSYVSVNGIDAAYDKLDELISKAVGAIECYYDNAEIFRELALKLKERTK